MNKIEMIGGSGACIYCDGKGENKYRCPIGIIELGGIVYPRIETNGVCWECKVRSGEYHHAGCFQEQCPCCNEHVALCDCEKNAWEYET